MFRLDFVDGAGGTIRAVTGLDVGILPTGDVLTQHMATARQRATDAALRRGMSVLVTRIDGAGRLRPTLVIRPDGGAQPPAAVKAEPCKRDSDEPGACFCRNCRASRRAR